MNQKTQKKVLSFICQKFTLQGKQTSLQSLAKWLCYLFESLTFEICLLITIIEPEFNISDQTSQYSWLTTLILLVRLFTALSYLLTHSAFSILGTKVLICLSLYCNREASSIWVLVLEFVIEIYAALRTQKRKLNFDSRLESKYLCAKVSLVYFLSLIAFLVPTEEIKQNVSSVFLIGLMYYIMSCLDMVYSYRVRETLKSIALGPAVMGLYFLFEPLVPAINTFNLVGHCLLSLSVFLIITCHPFLVGKPTSGTGYSFRSALLNSKISDLESSEKIRYLWDLIYFTENPSKKDLLCFLKAHQKVCSNSGCILSFNIDQQRGSFLLSSIELYIRKALQRFASEADEIRRLSIYYRNEDNPQVIQYLKEDDLYERIEEYRIGKNVQKYNDISLEYEHMKELELETERKVKLYLNHYDYFLSYISNEKIMMKTTEKIIEELLSLKKYFLSFGSEVESEQTDKENDLGMLQSKQVSGTGKVVGGKNRQLTKKGGSYEKVNEQNISIQKITLKTSVLVNFMRVVYFNMASLQKVECESKKYRYISEDIEQNPILVVSSENYNLGRILNFNTEAVRKLQFSHREMQKKCVNDLLPKQMHRAHEEIFSERALNIQLSDKQKSLSSCVFCKTKSEYIEVFEISIQASKSISGNKWIVNLKPQYQKQSVIVLNESREVIGVNANAIKFNIGLNATGEQLEEELFRRIVGIANANNSSNVSSIQPEYEKVTIERDYHPIDGFKMDQQTLWKVATETPSTNNIPKYYIVTIEQLHSVEKTTLSRFSKKALEQDKDPEMEPAFSQANAFEWKFDPFTLKYTNQALPAHEEGDLELIWMSELEQEEVKDCSMKVKQSAYEAFDAERSSAKYGENIHEMIYFEGKLEFKENYEQIMESETHPGYLENSLLQAKKRETNPLVSISKQNLMENVAKIQEQVPRYIYKLFVLSLAVCIFMLLGQVLKFAFLDELYLSAQQRELINLQKLQRVNTCLDIASLALYHQKQSQYPNVWQFYRSTEWNFEDLFVSVEYLNANVSEINPSIGSLTQKEFILDGQALSLQQLYQTLSIQASSILSGETDKGEFIKMIIEKVIPIQEEISRQISSYYEEHVWTSQTIIGSIDFFMLVLFLGSIVCVHLIVKQIFEGKVRFFKVFTVIEEEEIDQIQKNLARHKAQILSNELDQIATEDDYSETVESKNIPRTKKLERSLLESPISGALHCCKAYELTCLCVLIFLTASLVLNHRKAQLLTPFVNIINEERSSLSVLYLNAMSGLRNSSQITADLLRNVHLFEENKKGVIDSLIAKQFSEGFRDFYDEMWFTGCEQVGTSEQCDGLFFSILSQNLDYSFVYVLSEIEKVLFLEEQKATSPFRFLPTFEADAESKIEISYRKVIFLLYDFMIKVKAEFNEEIIGEIEVLTDEVDRQNLVGLIVTASILIFNFLLYCLVIIRIKQCSAQPLEMVTCVVPIEMLKRNLYFVDWYREKFNKVY